MRLFNQLLAERSIEAAETGRQPLYTGRYLVLLDESDEDDAIEAVSSEGQLNCLSATSGGEISSSQVREADAVVFPAINVALVDAPRQKVERLAAATSRRSPILAIEPERIVEAIEAHVARPDDVPADYRRGYRDAILDMTGAEAGASALPIPGMGATGPRMTWGLTSIGVDATTGTAEGTRVAVLDTGFFVDHPDFEGRTIHTESFISGETVDDAHGHGTHCIGTACGPVKSGGGSRYGVAAGADIYVGKVLSNGGSGGDGGILAGIDWAIRRGCQVISMSLGARSAVGQRPSPTYERVARRALERGTLIVAAAGNDSARPTRTEPVSHPANCPSIMAVGAVDSDLRIASFSNRAINPNGGEVNLVGPGVRVLSSWIAPKKYNTISGTSMATPHVAGVAAVICEETGLRGLPLARAMLDRCRAVGLAAADGGRGLVQVQ